MAVAQALAIPEILLRILTSEDRFTRRDHRRFTLVSRSWNPVATEVLWSNLPSLEALLCLLPVNAYDWISQRRRAYGRRSIKLTLDLFLNDDLCKLIRDRSRHIRQLTLRYDRYLMESCIREAVAAQVDTPTFSFLSQVHTLHIDSPTDFFVPEDDVYLPRCLCRGSGVRASFSANAIINFLPDVTTVFVNSSFLDLPPQHLHVLHISGVPLIGAVDIILARSMWLIDELCVEVDDALDASEVVLLLVAMAQACNRIRRLCICIHAFENGRPWIFASHTIRLLKLLPELVDLSIEAPLISRLSDAEWSDAVMKWPFMETLRVVPGSEFAWRYNLPMVTGTTPACTPNALAFIARNCPRLHTLAMPGMNCRTIPSLAQIQETLAVSAQHAWSGFSSLRELCVYDSPLADSGAMGAFLRLLFPNLDRVLYRQFPVGVDNQAMSADRWKEFEPAGWQEVNWYIQAHQVAE
ncbi:hypothetical protein FB107DRAFT_279930 [Schizophyllum commune]